MNNIFKDKSGKIVIGQWPNWPIWLTIGFYLLRFTPLPILNTLSAWGVPITLLYWSYLEITSGVNSFRRILGVIVALFQLKAIFGF